MGESNSSSINNSMNKRRLIALIHYLYDQTDENHPASTPQLLEYLDSQGLGTERKTLKANMDVLTAADSPYDIVEIKSKPNKYFYGTRELELAELKLLVDAVSSSRFITPKKSAQLVEKLGKFASVYQRAGLQRHMVYSSRVKAANENIYYIVEMINDAINSGRMIEFNYFEYNGNKEKVLRGDGELYYLSPYTLFWNEDFYYVIGWSDKHQNISSFRVDRMTNVEISRLAADEPPEDWNPDEYCRQVFEMYRGEMMSVTLECDNDLMKYVIDHFGEDVHTRPSREGTFLVTTDVSVSPNFYSWIFRFAGRMRIIAPESARQEYREMAEKVLEG